MVVLTRQDRTRLKGLEQALTIGVSQYIFSINCSAILHAYFMNVIVTRAIEKQMKLTHL